MKVATNYIYVLPRKDHREVINFKGFTTMLDSPNTNPLRWLQDQSIDKSKDAKDLSQLYRLFRDNNDDPSQRLQGQLLVPLLPYVRKGTAME